MFGTHDPAVFVISGLLLSTLFIALGVRLGMSGRA